MNRLVIPAAGTTLTGVLAIRLWKKGIKDLGLVAG